MLVKNWMTASVITVDAYDSVEKAIELLKTYNHRMLPVVDNKKLVGVITDRDIKEATGLCCTETGHLGPDFLHKTVNNIMKPNPITTYPEFTVDEAAELMLVNKISGLPVINTNGNVLGVITKSDVFRLWVLFAGAGKKGFQIGFSVLNEPGIIEQITKTIREYGGLVESILSTRERSEPGFRRVYIRFHGVDEVFFQRLIEILKRSFNVLYVVDNQKKIRNIYEPEKAM